MTDVNCFNICGEVTWHQNWEPKQWGGTIALRIALADDSRYGLAGQQIFCKVSYKKEQADSKRLLAVLGALNKPKATALITDGTLVNKPKENKDSYSLNTTLANLTVTEPIGPSKPGLNQAILFGSVEQEKDGFMLVKTAYRNPKTNEALYREVWAYVKEAPQETAVSGKWRFVYGTLATKGFDGQPATFVIADNVI